MPPDGILEGRGLTKRFGGVVALDAVDFAVAPGRVTALLGENGAGKSTLVACLSGAQQPDQGGILLEGVTIHLGSPDDARRRGIAVVHQEPQMLEEQSVAANIFLERLARGGFIADRRDWLERLAADHLASLGIRDIDPGRPMRTVAGAQRQLIEIARALIGDPRVLFLDEPNASLDEAETNRLFATVRTLRDQGVGVVLISHRLREAFTIADRVVVMRDGRKVLDDDVSRIPIDMAIRAIVGDGRSAITETPVDADARTASAADRSVDRRPVPGSAVLEVSNLIGPGFGPVSFSIRPGEIVGMAGLVGSGRSEIAHAVIGATRAVSGEIRLDGRRFRPRDPSEGVRAGVAYVPEGRREAVFYGQSVDFNVRAGIWGHLPRGRRRLRPADATARIRALLAQLAVKAADPEVRASTLSGGNQQKLLFARAMASEPRLLILDEPTHGVDVGTKRDTHELIRRLAQTGIAVWFISSEAEEVASLADRTIVVRHGRIVGELPSGAPIDRILSTSFGASEVGHGR